jgi:hypothetical protein
MKPKTDKILSVVSLLIGVALIPTSISQVLIGNSYAGLIMMFAFMYSVGFYKDAGEKSKKLNA